MSILNSIDDNKEIEDKPATGLSLDENPKQKLIVDLNVFQKANQIKLNFTKENELTMKETKSKEASEAQVPQSLIDGGKVESAIDMIFSRGRT